MRNVCTRAKHVGKKYAGKGDGRSIWSNYVFGKSLLMKYMWEVYEEMHYKRVGHVANVIYIKNMFLYIYSHGYAPTT